MKILLLTANINNKDKSTTRFGNMNMDLSAHRFEFKYITDDSLFSSDIDEFNSRRSARMYKILAPVLYPEYDFIIWTDASFIYKIHPEKFLNIQFELNTDIYLFKHTKRDCIYQEAETIKKLKLDYIDIIDSQTSYYKSKGMPENYGLPATGCIIWKVNKQTKKLAFEWWEQIVKFSSRDQMSLSYCLWKNDKTVNYAYCVKENLDIAKHNDFFKTTAHNHIKKI